MATAPTPGRVNASGPDTFSITVIVDGVRHTLYPDLITGADAAAVREQCGYSVRKLVTLAQDDPDIDILAKLVWIARCQAGDRCDLAEVAAAISYRSDIDVDAGETAIPDDHPSS